MDPNLFYLDWERLFEVLISIIVLAFFVERGLALVFETKLYKDRIQQLHIKELIAFAVSAAVCFYWDFDALSIIWVKETTTVPGTLITAAIIAGGSKAAIEMLRALRLIEKKEVKNGQQAGG